MSGQVHIRRIRYTERVGLSSLERLELSLRRQVLRDVSSLIHIQYDAQNLTATATLYVADVADNSAGSIGIINIKQYNKEDII